MAKIKKLHIKGIRGIKKEIELPLDGESILIYGDNGSGKSSITDAIEWFYKGSVEHLSNEEIGRGGIPALRNVNLAPSEEAFVEIEFSDNKLNCRKSIVTNNRGNLDTVFSNESQEFKNYLEATRKNEHIMLRNQELARFVIGKKSEKLESLSKIIGFNVVTDRKDKLRASLNKLKSEMEAKSFEDAKSREQGYLLETLKQNVNSEVEFINAINELISPLPIRKLESLNDVNKTIDLIKQAEDGKITEEINFLIRIKDQLAALIPQLSNLKELHSKYIEHYKSISENIETLKNQEFELLLNAGVSLLRNGFVDEDECPLCLQNKNKDELLSEISERMDKLKKQKEEVDKNKELKKETQNLLDLCIEQWTFTLREKHLTEVAYSELKISVTDLVNNLNKYGKLLRENKLECGKIKIIDEPQIDEKELKATIEELTSRIETIKKQKKDNLRFDILEKLTRAKIAYLRKVELNKEQEVYKLLVESLRISYSEFLKKQKEGLTNFLTNLSKDINDLYQEMYTDGRIQNVSLSLLEDEETGDLNGITLYYDFQGNKDYPPKKYFNESRINSLGIAYFLMSMNKYNKCNKMFILDDVISSFDSTHRQRFAELLIHKYSKEHQIIAFTHEESWFQIFSRLVKGKWIVKNIKWDNNDGSKIEEITKSLRQKIISNIENRIAESLGNDVRIYLEKLLKEVAFKIKAELPFRLNDFNEQRTPNELCQAVNSQLKKYPKVVHKEVFEKLITTTVLGNLESHDNSTSTNVDDLSAAWDKIIELEILLKCSDCNKLIEYVEKYKNLRCECGNKDYQRS